MHTAQQPQCRNFCQICTHARHPIFCLTGEELGVFRELHKEKWPRYIESGSYRTHKQRMYQQDVEMYPEVLFWSHYSDGIMGAMASQITSISIVSSTVYSDADQRKHQSSASLAFVTFPFDDVILSSILANLPECHFTPRVSELVGLPLSKCKLLNCIL